MMLDLAVLGLLRDGPQHGYELKRQLGELGFRRVSFGSLYPALRRLEKRDLIETTGAPSGRRKVFALTEAGRVEFVRLLEHEEEAELEEDRSFNLRLAFFRHLDPARRIRVLERRRAGLVEQLPAASRTLRASAGKARQAIDRYRYALMQRTVRSAEADIAWLDELIAAERGEQRAASDTSPYPPSTAGGEITWAQ